jgi:hypothetical protein
MSGSVEVNKTTLLIFVKLVAGEEINIGFSFRESVSFWRVIFLNHLAYFRNSRNRFDIIPLGSYVRNVIGLYYKST